MEVRERFITAKILCHEGPSVDVFEEDENGSRSVDCTIRLCMECVDSGREQRNSDFNAYINIL